MKIFLDSSILIEYVKGNKIDVLEAIVHPDSGYDPYINHIVYSEFLFHFLSLTARKSPLTLKNSSAISTLLTQDEPIEFIRNFSVVEMNTETIERSYEFMIKYNLLPNDALIFASCISHKIPCLATYDRDFIAICEQEEIQMIQNLEDIRN